ncbi:hypothetical protein BOTBODRAFT_598127 [Botryobasidium botryosum FD-172 SS1]|uniref:Uncharacterized protein n=1 Tax=Botryobasidium botryosum (strain FD-172 SS1) TaxID=930990 RepID=A0A067LW53_BOTB1|nr:hypothetical protein BOTBODRAFT_598127 [Botryobasidium botryosum FD-172 SS1]
MRVLKSMLASVDYWINLPSNPHPDDRLWRQCFSRILLDVLNAWNLEDDNKVLASKQFEEMVYGLIQDLNPGNANLNPSYSQDGTTIIRKLSEASVNADPAGAGGRGLSLDIYERGPLAPMQLAMLMGFIVDLTMVLERLFWTMFRKDIPSVSIEHVQKVFNKYIISGERTKIHREIIDYTKSRSPRALDKAHQEAKRLVEIHRTVPRYRPKESTRARQVDSISSPGSLSDSGYGEKRPKKQNSTLKLWFK